MIEISSFACEFSLNAICTAVVQVGFMRLGMEAHVAFVVFFTVFNEIVSIKVRSRETFSLFSLIN